MRVSVKLSSWSHNFVDVEKNGGEHFYLKSTNSTIPIGCCYSIVCTCLWQWPQNKTTSQGAARQHRHPPRHRVKLSNRPPWVETQGHEVFKELCFKEYRFVAVYMVWPAPQLEWLCNVGAVGVKTHSFCWLDYRPDGRDLLGIADTTSILELRNLILVEPFSGGKDCLTVHGSGSPPRRGDGLTKLHHVGPDGVICFKSSSAISTLFLSSHFHQILCPLFHMLPCIVLA